MLDVIKSIDNLAWTTEHHFQHIKNQHDFIRAVAFQFELSYTDFCVIQLALQLDPTEMDLLKRFSAAYENEVYPFESEFAFYGLDAFNEKYGEQIDQYEQGVQKLLVILDEIKNVNSVAE